MASTDNQLSIRNSLCEDLEDRRIFSAGPIEAAHTQPVVPQAETVHDASIELIVVDSAVEDAFDLIHEITGRRKRDQFEVVGISAEFDGIDELTAILVSRNVSAMHLIVAHGGEGRIRLGNTELSVDNIEGYAGDLANWQGSMTSDADLLIYGCGLAESDEGVELVQSLAALTGTKVIANDS